MTRPARDTRVIGLLLAAGAGRRYGTPKALVDTGTGPWVTLACATLLDGGCDEVLVVTGARSERVTELLTHEGDARVRCVTCPTWSAGMGESLATGLRELAGAGAHAALVHLVDLPDVGPPVVARLLDAGTRMPIPQDALLRATYRRRPGHPVFLGSSHWAPIVDSAHGDVGARDYLRETPHRDIDCGDLAEGADVDVPRAPGSERRTP